MRPGARPPPNAANAIVSDRCPAAMRRPPTRLSRWAPPPLPQLRSNPNCKRPPTRSARLAGAAGWPLLRSRATRNRVRLHPFAHMFKPISPGSQRRANQVTTIVPVLRFALSLVAAEAAPVDAIVRADQLWRHLRRTHHRHLRRLEKQWQRLARGRP